jgi:hypothetical protein
MLALAALSVVLSVRQVVALDHANPPPPPWALDLVPDLEGPAAVMIGWLAVVLLLALTGRRRAAAALACIPLALDLVVALNLVTQQTGAWSG